MSDATALERVYDAYPDNDLLPLERGERPDRQRTGDTLFDFLCGKVGRVELTLEPAGSECRIVVTDDDPDGFTDLSHAYTMFAESEKKKDERQRGRFNVGEKNVLAICREAVIRSTKGTVVFDEDGRRYQTDEKTERGSVFTAMVGIDPKTELPAVIDALRTLIPPTGVETIINGVPLAERTPLRTFEETLITEVADGEGVLKRTRRKAEVRLYTPLPGEKAMLYELGVPVVETDDKYHVDVQQKVPVTRDRDNVPPSYLKHIRTATLNATSDLLSEADANSSWVNEALGDERCTADAAKAVITEKFGDNVAIFDPSDHEANAKLRGAGFAVLGGRSLTKEQWANVKGHDVIQPSGKIMPTVHDAGALPNIVSDEKVTPGMKVIECWTVAMAARLLSIDLRVVFTNNPNATHDAQYIKGPSHRALEYNVGNLGYGFFDGTIGEGQIDLLLHELAHERSGDHLSHEYHKGLSSLGARLTQLALTAPELFVGTYWEGKSGYARSRPLGPDALGARV